MAEQKTNEQKVNAKNVPGLERYTTGLPEDRVALLKLRVVLQLELRDIKQQLLDPQRKENMGDKYKEWLRNAQKARHVKKQQLSAIDYKLADKLNPNGLLASIERNAMRALLDGADMFQFARDTAKQIREYFDNIKREP